MKRFRVTSALLACVCALALAACGGADDTATTAGSTPAVASTAAAPTSSAAEAAGGAGDKEICESARKAGEDMKSSLLTGEEPAPAVFKKILTDLDKEVTSLAEAGGDSEVSAALRKFGAEAAKAAKAADPAGAADNPAIETAGADITAACEPTGVNVNF